MKSWVGYILAVFGFVIYGAATNADRDSTGAIVSGGNVDAFQVKVGDCFNDASMEIEEISNVAGVPCSEPHDNETYALVNLTIDNYPGADQMGDLANDACMEEFAGFVGRDYESSSLDILTMYPSADSWKQDDREVICAVYDMNIEKLVGTAKDSGL